jgi:hypothetical protein
MALLAKPTRDVFAPEPQEVDARGQRETVLGGQTPGESAQTFVPKEC